MTDSERARFEILLEAIQDKISLVAEGHGVLFNKMEHIEQDIGVLKADVGTLKSDVSILKTDVNTLKSDVKELKTDVSMLKSDVSELKTDVADIKPRVLRIEQHLGLNGKPLSRSKILSPAKKAPRKKH